MTETAATYRWNTGLYSLITESDFTAQVIDLARHLGWRVAHFRPAMTKGGRWVTAVQGDGAGFPDLVLVRGQRLILAELKSANGKLSEAQAIWLAMLKEAAPETYLWRPSDIDEIERLLR